MHKQEYKKAMESLSRDHDQRAQSSGKYSDTLHMASQMGNQAMLGLMRSDWHTGVGGPSLVDEMRAKFGLSGRSAEQSAQATPQSSSLPDYMREKFGTGSRSRTPSTTGGQPLPDALRKKYEEKSGLPMDDVRVHYNSGEPDKFSALAYTYGSEVYIGPGQEQHLEHELGHVVQQKRGLVIPNTRVCGNPANNDIKLEKDADSIGRCTTFGMVNIPHESGIIQCQGKEIGNDEENTLKIRDENGHEYEITKKKLTEFINKDTNLSDERKKQFTAYLETIKFELIADDAGYDAESEVISYTDKLNIYTRIPSIDEDYETYRRIKMSSEACDVYGKEEWAILVTLLHEIGHYDQGKQNFSRKNTSPTILEYHNLLFNENSAIGRNRVVYLPDAIDSLCALHDNGSDKLLNAIAEVNTKKKNLTNAFPEIKDVFSMDDRFYTDSDKDKFKSLQEEVRVAQSVVNSIKEGSKANRIVEKLLKDINSGTNVSEVLAAIYKTKEDVTLLKQIKEHVEPSSVIMKNLAKEGIASLLKDGASKINSVLRAFDSETEQATKSGGAVQQFNPPPPKEFPPIPPPPQ